MIQFVNAKSADDGFTALHFCSFKGNVDLCMFLIEKGADKFATNNFGINMLQVLS